MRLGVIGCGAIGTDFAKAADKMKEIEKIYLFDINKKSSENLCRNLKKAEVKKVSDFLTEVDVVFEGASQDAVIEYAEQIINKGKDLILMSVGSLFDDNFRKKLEKTASKTNCKIYIPSGAICGIDGIISASVDLIDEVTLVTTKPPQS
ncbi:aspartate dehydrogenase, partial [Candidatus Woesearchaeota archaeon]|nr:aspartate dehydrogenase [Candidatus Woesearchaeota archaeon]